MEGISAQHYWKHLISLDFLRHRFGDWPNPFFNFGYMVETGLLPVLGIFHKNKYNPYCLADDMMEPYRPFVDQLVMDWLEKHPNTEDLNKDFKAHILQIASQDVLIEDKKRPMMVAIKTSLSSLYKCYTGEKRQLAFPRFA